MRSKIQVKLVKEHMKYLEEKIQVLEPAISEIKKAVDKSKIWIEDKNNNPSITYIELYQELESATTAIMDAASYIINDVVIVEGGTPSLFQSTPHTTGTEKRDHNESNQIQSEVFSRLEQIETAISSLQDVSRLEQIETAISSLQDVSRLEQIETAISSLQDVSRLEQIETAISSLQDVSRLEQIETAISSLQDVSRLEQIETAISSLQDVSRLEQIETAISSLQDVSRLEQIETAISSLQDVSRLEQIETAISSLQDVSRLEQIETAISSLQDVSRLEQIETAISSLQDVSRLEQIETSISSLQDVSRLEQIETAISSLQDVSRLEQIETVISSLQDANDKSTDDISKIKQWRVNFVTEQSDLGVHIEKLTKKQKQNFKNLRKQMSEQDNNVKQLNKEIESLKEKETKSNKTLEKLSLDMKEYENKLDTINKEMQDHTDKTQSKHNVMYKLLQQRLMPIDKLIQIFNQNLETRKERINKADNIENTNSKLSKNVHLIDSRVCNRYACHVALGDHTLVSNGSTISSFGKVREFNGQHFDQTTGKFLSPHDGLYLVCVTLHECQNKLIKVGVVAGGRWCRTIEVKCADTSAAGSVVVDMKKGQELYLEVYHADQGAALSLYSSFTIVSL
ncbi:leucine zipper protein 1-like isoform X1 [Physella acuta]|uniref:leucine zipper protein 1-like isoform X1 n=1 Tax=Physella acuta TaxID=109671 RepID=UPI0027DB3661|nr:leucine zipper protein 1-like isoform X1 [Physella acuta]